MKRLLLVSVFLVVVFAPFSAWAQLPTSIRPQNTGIVLDRQAPSLSGAQFQSAFSNQYFSWHRVGGWSADIDRQVSDGGLVQGQWYWRWGGYNKLMRVDHSHGGSNWHVQEWTCQWSGDMTPTGDYDGDGYLNNVDPDTMDPNNPPPDSDGDGIPDNIDPYPNDPSPFNWGKVMEIRDANGVLKAVLVKTEDGELFWMGDRTFADNCLEGSVTCNRKILINLGNEFPYTQASWASQFGGMSPSQAGVESGVTNQVVSGERQVSPATGIVSGVTPAQGDSDSSLLAKIATNTASTASNMQALANRLKAIEAEQRDGNLMGAAGGSGGSSSSVSQGMASRDAAVQSEAEAAYSDEMGTISNTDPSTVDQEGFGQGEAPEKNLLADLWDSFLSNNPVSAALSSSGVELSSPTCSFSSTVAVMGASQEVVFSFCDYADVLDYFGVFIFGIAGLFGLIIMARG